jgi:hypothetical protein
VGEEMTTMSITINNCIRAKDWHELSILTYQQLAEIQATEQRRNLINANRNKGKEAIQYEIDKGRKIKLRKR